MFISCVWNALSPDLASIRTARIFQGFGMSAPQWYALRLRGQEGRSRVLNNMTMQSCGNDARAHILVSDGPVPCTLVGAKLNSFSQRARAWLALRYMEFFPDGGDYVVRAYLPADSMSGWANAGDVGVPSSTATSSRTYLGSSGSGSLASHVGCPSCQSSFLCLR